MDWGGTPTPNDHRAQALTDTGYVLCEALSGGKVFTYWSRQMPSQTTLQQVKATHPGFDEAYASDLAIVGQSIYATGILRPTAGQTGSDQGYFWLVDPAGSTNVTSFQIGSSETRPAALNRDGLMVGRKGNLVSAGFIRSLDPSLYEVVLHPLAGYSTCWALGIHGGGGVVGASKDAQGQVRATAWLPSSATPRALDWLDPSYPYAQAAAVNDGKHAVGWSQAEIPQSVNSPGPKAVIWTSLSPAPLDRAGSVFVSQVEKARAISPGIPNVLAEQVVGEYWDDSVNHPQHYGFIWDQATGFQDLGSLVSNLPSGYVVERATDINSLGEISVIMAETGSGRQHAYLLTPNLTSPRLGRLDRPIAGDVSV
ncbi:MAG: hypothetical protein D6702_12600, partial [Planctomycetota bacterium]